MKLIFLLLFLVACDPNQIQEPEVHRPTEIPCDNDRQAANQGFEGDTCQNDSDCTEGQNGRCVANRGSYCTYDECFSDNDCDNVCVCEGENLNRGNHCLPGNCAVDADCPNEGYCSPSLGTCGNYGGFVAYYCRTSEDECTNDSDCGGTGYCAFSPEAQRWACGYGQCIG